MAVWFGEHDSVGVDMSIFYEVLAAPETPERPARWPAAKLQRHKQIPKFDDVVDDREKWRKERNDLLLDREKLRKERDDVIQERDDLQEERDALTHECDELLLDREELRKERDDVLHERDDLRKERDALNHKCDELKQSAADVAAFNFKDGLWCAKLGCRREDPPTPIPKRQRQLLGYA